VDLNWEHIADEAVDHLRALLRIDTTNPPGNERQAADYLAQILSSAGYDPLVLESAPSRGSVVTRYRGSGKAAPLLLLSHLDVVPAEAERWDHDPFGGEVVDGVVWGRGALDMKSIVVMQLMTMLLLKRKQAPLARDVIFAATADEEMGGEYGTGFLVDRHADLIRAEYALSEFGGFLVDLGGRRVYLCQVAEKGICWVRMRARGNPGHGSMPRRDSSLVRLAQAVARLGQADLPFHRTDAATEMLEGMARSLGGVRGAALRLLMNPVLNRAISRLFLADQRFARYFHALFHNTVSPTVLHAGSKTNVIPSEAEVELDGRTLPGQSLETFLDEVRAVVGPGFEFEPIQVAPALQTTSHTPLFAKMVEGLRRHDPGAAVVPMMMVGGTDAKHLARAGIPCYGFSPMRLPPEMDFLEIVHGHNERIPITALSFGVQVLYEVVEGFCSGANRQ
jgi:acetylornithine deacetylase/succinyl-diaminopimelate desuccinylase-like protein